MAVKIPDSRDLYQHNIHSRLASLACVELHQFTPLPCLLNPSSLELPSQAISLVEGRPSQTWPENMVI